MRNAGSRATTARSAAAGRSARSRTRRWSGSPRGRRTQGLALDPAAVAAWRAGCDCLGPLASPKPLLRRLLLLDSADRAGPSRLAELAEPALRRWRGDPGYRPRPLRRLAGLIQV